jgi:hypothetical protein
MKLFDVGKFTQLFRKDDTDESLGNSSHCITPKELLGKKKLVLRDDDKMERK